MAKARSSNGMLRKKNGIAKLKVVVEKLQRSLYLSRRSSSSSTDEQDQEFEEMGSVGSVPEDVKEGHFAVIAKDDGHPKRFMVSLRYLSHPLFVRLLEQAAEKYGFDHEGALTIPCSLSELESILAETEEEMISSTSREVVNGGGWGSSCKTMVESC